MKKRVKRKFNFFRFIIFILIIYIIYLVISYILDVNTKNIIILNTNYYSDEEIIETASLENYPKFLSLSTKEVEDNLLKLPLIETVDVKKKWGYILEIDIKEKTILYYIRSNNTYMLSDNKEYNLDNVLSCATLINYVPEDIETKFVNGLSKIDKDILGRISEIEYSKTSYDDERFLLYMTDGNQVYINISKIEMLNKYLSIIQKLDNKKGILYLDSGNYFEIKEK